MKDKLNIKDTPGMFNSTEHEISGFTADEIADLAGMGSQEALDWILERVNEQYDGRGTAWHNAYGIHWFQIRPHNNTVLVVTGKSCC